MKFERYDEILTMCHLILEIRILFKKKSPVVHKIPNNSNALCRVYIFYCIVDYYAQKYMYIMCANLIFMVHSRAMCVQIMIIKKV